MWPLQFSYSFIIDREAREIIRLVVSICPSVHLSVFFGNTQAFSYTIYMVRSGRYMGLACRVLRKITVTSGIQPKISVCLSVIRKR